MNRTIYAPKDKELAKFDGVFVLLAADAAVTCNSVEITVNAGMCAGKTIKNHKGCFDAAAPAADPKGRDAYLKVRP